MAAACLSAGSRNRARARSFFTILSRLPTQVSSSKFTKATDSIRTGSPMRKTLRAVQGRIAVAPPNKINAAGIPLRFS